MEAFVAVAKAQGDESQLSSGNSLVDSASSAFNSSCRNTKTTAGTGRPNFTQFLPLATAATTHNNHNASSNNNGSATTNSTPSSTSSSRRDLLDNGGHYWKYLVGESSSTTNMVPQEPTMATNDGVTKTPSPSGTS